MRRAAARISNASGSTDQEWSILLTDDDQVRQLNHDYRGKDRTTDVLSFPLAEPRAADDPAHGVVPLLLGDVVISVEQAARQAPDGDLLTEIKRLLVHGHCHLRGHRHHTTRDAKRMRRAEEQLLDLLGLAEGLVSRSS